MVAVELPALGEACEGYWPEDDTWLLATLSAVNGDGTVSITWDQDGSMSDVAADYVRKLQTGEEVEEEEVAVEEEVEEEEVEAEEEPAAEIPKAATSAAAAPVDDTDIDALMAAAAAAGALDEADSFVEGSKAPSQMHWAKALDTDYVDKNAVEQPGAKRERPLGLMSSAAAKEMCLAAKKGKTR